MGVSDVAGHKDSDSPGPPHHRKNRSYESHDASPQMRKAP